MLTEWLEPPQVLEAINRARKWLDDAPPPEAIVSANALADQWMDPVYLKNIRSSPLLSFADYLELKATDFVFNFDSGKAEGRYISVLKPGPALPDRAYLQVTFENPREYFNPFVEYEVIEGKPEEIRVESPRSDGFICGPYVVNFGIYADEARSNLLGVLRIMVRSTVNASVIRSQEDMIDKVSHGHACQ
jgi:hypothetical protein